MKRYNTPLLGSHYGATIRLLGPHNPQPVLHPLEELEPIRNPFLPPDAAHGTTPQLPQQGATLRLEPGTDTDTARFQRDRESDAWANDTPSRLLPKVPASGRMVFGSFLIFAVLGVGGFAALYSAVHSDDADVREQNAAEEAQEARGTAVPNAALATPVVPVELAPLPAMSSAPAEAAKIDAPPSRIDSGAQAAAAGAAPAAVAAPASEPSHVAHASAAPSPAPAAAPARVESISAPKVVVHVEPAPVVPAYLSSHHETQESEGPISEDAVLGSSPPSPPDPPTAESNAASRSVEPTPASTPGARANPDDLQK